MSAKAFTASLILCGEHTRAIYVGHESYNRSGSLLVYGRVCASGTVTPLTWPGLANKRRPRKRGVRMPLSSNPYGCSTRLKMYRGTGFVDIANVYKDQLPSSLAIHVKVCL